MLFLGCGWISKQILEINHSGANSCKSMTAEKFCVTLPNADVKHRNGRARLFVMAECSMSHRKARRQHLFATGDATRISSQWGPQEENSINTTEQEHCVLISFGLTYLRLAVRRLLCVETEGNMNLYLIWAYSSWRLARPRRYWGVGSLA